MSNLFDQIFSLHLIATLLPLNKAWVKKTQTDGSTEPTTFDAESLQIEP